MRAPPSLLVLLGLSLAACLPPSLAECTDPDCIPATTGDTGDPSPPTTGDDPGVYTVTGDEPAPASTSEPDPGATTGAPIDPPAILDFDLDPNPITINGLIDVTVTAEYADGVRMQLDDGTEVELESRDPDIFTGSIPIFTGLLNGDHDALLTPWQAPQFPGLTVPAPYTVQLPVPGSQIFWETGDLIGPGEVAALVTLPTGELVELGTHSPQGKPRCYLRRRDKGGAWGPDDIVDILPGIDCAAVDLQVDEFGALYVLVNRQGQDGLRWWVAKISSWGLGAKNLGTGSEGETATALAAHPSGDLAVCGFAPTPVPEPDDDAMVWLFRPNQPGETLALDYEAGKFAAHYASERTRDCTFSGDTLVLAGEANGRHEGLGEMARDRLFFASVDMQTKTANWTVTPPGAKTTQSAAQTTTIDDEGRILLAGYVCGDDCDPEGELRIYDLDGTLVWFASLGAFPTPQWTARDIAWSPAKYVVVATGGITGKESSFSVRAFAPFKYDPLWTFTREDGQVLNSANALAIGLFGEVYAGGFGANGYPAVAYIAG